jgi:UTP--glucose-1-phosphate uridylyltransferase
MKVKKAVIPAAGLGTRFLPITKAVPKEMLPIVDKPALQYIIEEIVNSGINDILIITGRGKKCIEDHFDVAHELDNNLELNNKSELLEISKSLNDIANLHFIRQHEAKGLANAVMCAKAFVGNEPFALLLGDDMVYNNETQKPCIKQLIDCYEKTGLSTIATMKVEREAVGMYGNIGINEENGRIKFVNNIIEKPLDNEILSDNVIIGRYVLSSDIFNKIINSKPHSNGEVYFTDALLQTALENGLAAYEFEGKRYDTGDKIGYLKANVEYALRDKKLGSPFKEYIKELYKTF